MLKLLQTKHGQQLGVVNLLARTFTATGLHYHIADKLTRNFLVASGDFLSFPRYSAAAKQLPSRLLTASLLPNPVGGSLETCFVAAALFTHSELGSVGTMCSSVLETEDGDGLSPMSCFDMTFDAGVSPFAATSSVVLKVLVVALSAFAFHSKNWRKRTALASSRTPDILYRALVQYTGHFKQTCKCGPSKKLYILLHDLEQKAAKAVAADLNTTHLVYIDRQAICFTTNFKRCTDLHCIQLASVAQSAQIQFTTKSKNQKRCTHLQCLRVHKMIASARSSLLHDPLQTLCCFTLLSVKQD